MQYIGKTELSLAEYVVKIIGGEKRGAAAETARQVGVSYSEVSKWKTSKVKGGYGGDIPRRRWPKILAIAKERNLPISAEDFVEFVRRIYA